MKSETSVLHSNDKTYLLHYWDHSKDFEVLGPVHRADKAPFLAYVLKEVFSGKATSSEDAGKQSLAWLEGNA
jgi:hypothetical protein